MKLAIRRASIVVIGGGPVGLVLALDLAGRGIPSIVINAEATTRWFPKGSTHNSRTMEHYRRLGFADDVRKVGLPADHPTDVGYFTRLSSHELARIQMPSSNEKMAATRQSDRTYQIPEPIHRANQMYVERILLDRAAGVKKIQLLYGYRCVDLTDNGHQVTVTVEDSVSGGRLAVLCDFAVGCDGGQSIIRRLLGVAYEGEPPVSQPFLGGPMLATHLRAPGLFPRGVRRSCWQYWVVNPELRSLFVSLNGEDEFLLYSTVRNDDDGPDDGSIRRLVQRSAGVDIGVELIGHSPWTAGLALVAEKFSRGRVYLCGDSAHLFTPTGGFGMNTGIDDAANLAWKLAACLKGWSGLGLLATYEIERKPIAHRNTAAARMLARNVGAVHIPETLEEESPAGRNARLQVGSILSTFGEEFGSIGIQLGARYDGSPIVVADGTSPPTDDPATYVPSACPGGRAPHFWMADGTSLFDHVGLGFTLLIFNVSKQSIGGLESAFRARGVPLTTLRINIPEARELYSRDLALLRPDQHVAWRGDRLPRDCELLLSTVLGADVAIAKSETA